MLREVVGPKSKELRIALHEVLGLEGIVQDRLSAGFSDSEDSEG